MRSFVKGNDTFQTKNGYSMCFHFSLSFPDARPNMLPLALALKSSYLSDLLTISSIPKPLGLGFPYAYWHNCGSYFTVRYGQTWFRATQTLAVKPVGIVYEFGLGFTSQPRLDPAKSE